MEALGFIPFWGFTPAIDFFQNTQIDPSKDDRDLNIFISECADIRHVLKSLSDTLNEQIPPRKHKLNIYIHEKQRENICRDILFLTLICETGISERERQEIFLDLYGNTMIRDKTAEYLEHKVPELIQLVTDDDRCKSPLLEFVSFSNLKFTNRDDLEEIFSSYLKAHPFDVEKLRDQRLRHHF